MRILDLSGQATREQRQAISLETGRRALGIRKATAVEDGHWRNSGDARQRLGHEVAQLRLVGQRLVREAAAQLLGAQYLMDEARFSKDRLGWFENAEAQVKECEDALIDAARVDLGIYQG